MLLLCGGTVDNLRNTSSTETTFIFTVQTLRQKKIKPYHQWSTVQLDIDTEPHPLNCELVCANKLFTCVLSVLTGHVRV